MNTKLATLAATALLSATLLSGCGSDEPDNNEQQTDTAPSAIQDKLLSQIPAETPYFFASRERLSEEESMALIEKLGTIEEIDSQLAELEQLQATTDEPGMQEFLGIMITVLKAFEDVKTLEDYHQIGLMPNARSAVYGLGLLPAARMELHDEELFRAFFEGLISDMNVELQQATLGDTDYWHTSADEMLQTLIAIRDDQVIIGLLPSTAGETVVEQLFGITPPLVSLLESGEMLHLEQRYHYSPYGSGRISSKGLVSEFISPQHPASQALLQLDETNPADLEACRDDIDRLTSLFPALVMGIHELDSQRIAGSLRLATSSELAADMSSLTATVPGLGSGKGVASLGMALDVQALTSMLQKYSRHVHTTPFTCPELQGINEAWAESGTLTNHPMTTMLSPALHGVNLRIDSLETDQRQPTGTGLIAFSSPNAQSLLSAASMFIPQIASLNLQADGEIKKIQPDLLPPDMPTVHAAMSQEAILLGVGLDKPTELKSELTVEADPRSLMTYGHISSDLYATLAEIGSQLPGAQAPDADELKRLAEVYEKTEFWIGIDAGGIELGMGVELK
ncbi:hypothetical protein [Nitrincola iocasae]|uniref:DUF3352 domain-containing protein n=1 Tax=Nitrincola iocasae TaxID=2614693 RepID=A0A5J6LHA4_9GAMM|nr:hypothetical protein [Nitrincola iocasae]QEW07989.1 hypothetical protein F5I99_16660 [Nitrincola iocasae]